MKTHHKKIVLLGLLLFGIGTSLQAQSLRNDMISSAGGSHLLKEAKLTVHQSIGQSSVIGVFTNSSSTLAQGFLRGIQPMAPQQQEPFEVIPFPNAFSKIISFRFVQGHQDKTSFIIYDINGKEIFNDILTPIDNEVQLNLDYLAAGVYLAFIRSGNRFIQKRIVKKE